MTKSTGLFLGCFGLLAATVVAGWSDAHAVAVANATIAELDHWASIADQRSRQAALRIDAATNDCAQLEKSLAKLTTARASPPSKGRTTTSVSEMDWARHWEKQLQDPDVQNENLAVARAQLHDQFAPLYRALHLSPQQIAAFEENEARYEARLSDLNAALVKERISSFDPVAATLFGKLADEEKASQKEVLGEPGYAAYQDFQRTSIVRGMVSRLVGATTVMGEPLNADQSEQLIRVIAHSDSNYATGGSAGMNVDWSRVFAAAQPILSPAQMDILKNFEPPGGGRLWFTFSATAAAAAKSDPLTNGGTPAPGQ